MGKLELKIFLLSSAESVHTVRWANALTERGIKVFLFTHTNVRDKLHSNVVVTLLKYRWSKNGVYFFNTKLLRRQIEQHCPDIIHAHFASGYGTLAANASVRYLLSVWGDDVYEFPRRSRLHKYLLTRTLNKADKIFSTSRVMAVETNKYVNRNIVVIPFGVDIPNFSIQKQPSNRIRLGIVKVMAEKYGVDVLLRAYHILKNKYSNIEMSLDLYGDGPALPSLRKIHEDMRKTLPYRADEVNFHGRIDNEMVPKVLTAIDIFVIPSRSDGESFGVAAVEAGASATACVVSEVGGLPEVVLDGKTGVVIQKDDPQALAAALERLILDKSFRDELGMNARENVIEKYDWNVNVSQMIRMYREHVQDEIDSGKSCSS